MATDYLMPAWNFAKGIYGNQNPTITSSMQKDLINRAQTTGLDKGSLGYSDFGAKSLETGRFGGGIKTLAKEGSSPFANALSLGRVSFKKDPNAPGGYTFGDTKYDFNVPDTPRGAGLSGFFDPENILRGINYGGLKTAVPNFYQDFKAGAGDIWDNIKNEFSGSAEASIPTRDEMIKAGITKKMIEEGTATPMGRRYGNMSMGQGRPDWVADRSPVQQGLKEIEIGMAPFVANRIPGQQDLASDFFMDSITKDSKFYDPYKPTFRDQIKKGFNKYAKPVMGGIMSAISGIPGMGLLMNAFNNPDPYAQNRIDMYGAYRGRDGAIKDKFGYNVGKTLMKNRYMEPGSNSYRSYALDAMRGMDKAGRRPALDKYYQQTYGKTWDQVKKDHQKKKDPFNNTNPFSGTADNFAGGADKSFDTGQPSTAGVKGSSYSRGDYGGRGHHWAKGGIVSLWRR